MSYLTTFRVSEVKPVKIRIPTQYSTSSEHIVTHLDTYRESHCIRVISGSEFERHRVYPSSNGFVKAVTDAYNNHHRLLLRPDDVWLAILTQFSFYVNGQSEQLRSKFVDFNGKCELTVGVTGELSKMPYRAMIGAMEEAIHSSLVDDGVRDWVIPDFSTTSDEDRLVAGVILMATMKTYFDYRFRFVCGIPSVTLDGTLDDWKELRLRINKLDEYDLGEWSEMLKTILDEFIRAKSGKPDVEFWGRICLITGQASGPRYLNGWISAFCYFNKDGKCQGSRDGEWLRMDTCCIPPGIVQADAIIESQGKAYKTSFIGGTMGQQIGNDEYTLQPWQGWAVALK